MSLQELAIVTGMSGSGKATVLKAFEDLGFFCIDNLPVALIPKFIEGIHVSGGEVAHVALTIDIRAGEGLKGLAEILSDLRQYEFRVSVIFLEASDQMLVRRFSETRRPHPLTVDRPLREAIRLERRRLREVRELADIIIDTTTNSIHQTKAQVTARFRAGKAKAALNVHMISFGYKHGVPLEADLLFDVRFLPNPFFVPGLRQFSGRHARIRRYLRSFPETGEFVRRVREFIRYLVPFYVREGKTYLTVGIGCTGGRHRSVFVAEEIARTLKLPRTKVRVRHRDESR
jgi:RNase adapter protein RapZ